MNDPPPSSPPAEGSVRGLFEAALSATPGDPDFPEWAYPPRLPYEPVTFVGDGGSGKVWRVRHAEEDRILAFKVIPFQSGGNLPRERWLREARIISAVKHPNLVSILDCGLSPDGTCGWLALSWAEGRTLRDLLTESATLAWSEVLPVLRQTCEGLTILHESGVVHRDIKPANLVLDRETGHLTILDFGVAASRQEERLTRTHEAILSPGYSAPEQNTAGHDLDSRSDQYALAITAWQLLTGQLPMGSFGSLVSDAPPHVEPALRRAMNPEPAARFPDIASFLNALESPRKRSLGWKGALLLILVLLVSFIALKPQGNSSPSVERAKTSRTEPLLFDTTPVPIAHHPDGTLRCRLLVRPEGKVEIISDLQNKSPLLGVTATFLIILRDEESRPVLVLNGGYYGVNGTLIPGASSERTDFIQSYYDAGYFPRIRHADCLAFATNPAGRQVYREEAIRLQNELTANGGAFHETKRTFRELKWWPEGEPPGRLQDKKN